MIALHPRMLELGALVDALDFSLVKMCSSVLGTGKLSDNSTAHTSCV